MCPQRIGSAWKHGGGGSGGEDEVLLTGFWDAARRVLLTGPCLRPKAWPLTSGASRSAAHTSPIVRALYNDQFNEVRYCSPLAAAPTRHHLQHHIITMCASCA